MARKFLWKVIFTHVLAIGHFLTFSKAGSALIQACEKAGATIPRYVISTAEQDHLVIFADNAIGTAIMSTCLLSKSFDKVAANFKPRRKLLIAGNCMTYLRSIQVIVLC